MSATADLRVRFFSNLRAHVVSRLLQGGVGFLLVPYVLSRLSREEYGLWTWLLAMSAWLTLADLGLSTGNVNPLARSLGSRDERRVGEILVAAIALHAAIAFVLLGVAVLAHAPLTAALPPSQQALAFETLLLLLVAQAFVVVSFPFGALLSALQRLDVVHKVQSGQLLLQAAATVTILERGGRVLDLAWMQLGLGVFQLGVRAFLARRLHPSLRLVWPAAARFPALVSAGLPVVLLGVVGAIALNFERTYLGFVVDLALLAQYAVALRLVMTVREIPQVLLSALVPASAALDVAGDDRALGRLHSRGFRLSVAVVLALTAALFVCAPALLHAWLGSGFEPAGRVARLLAIAILPPLVTAPGVQVLIGRSRLGRVAPVYVVWGGAFVLVNVVWLSFMGFAGAGWGAAVVNVLGAAALLGWMHRRGGLAMNEAASVLLKGVAAAMAAALVGEAIAWLIAGAIDDGSRLAALVVAAGAVAAVAATHLALAWKLRLLDVEDGRLLADALGFRVR